MSLTCPMRTATAIDTPLTKAQTLNRGKDKPPKGGVNMAILNNGKLIDRRYQSNTAPKKEETSVVKIGVNLIAAVVVVVGILAVAVLADVQD